MDVKGDGPEPTESGRCNLRRGGKDWDLPRHRGQNYKKEQKGMNFKRRNSQRLEKRYHEEF